MDVEGGRALCCQAWGMMTFVHCIFVVELPVPRQTVHFTVAHFFGRAGPKTRHWTISSQPNFASYLYLHATDVLGPYFGWLACLVQKCSCSHCSIKQNGATPIVGCCAAQTASLPHACFTMHLLQQTVPLASLFQGLALFPSPATIFLTFLHSSTH